MPADHWCARPMAQPKGYPTKFVLDGPGLFELLQQAFFDVALSIHEGDGRAERFTDYVLAVGRLHADDGDIGEEATETLTGFVADAWFALADDLGTSLYLDEVEAQVIVHKLYQVGRVGIEGTRTP